MSTLLMTHPIVNAYQGADFFGKVIFLFLILLSVITWILFLQKFFLQREVTQKGTQLIQLFRKKQLSPLSIEIKGPLHPFATLYHTLKEHALELLQKNQSVLGAQNKVMLSSSDMDLIATHLTIAVSAETKEVEKNLFVLPTVVSLAPFLGLLGTVWGILLTFAELQKGAAVNANATIMGGLAMALGTTVLGLLVAIPALIGYNYLKAKNSQMFVDMEDFSQILLASVELHYRQVEISNDGAPQAAVDRS